MSTDVEGITAGDWPAWLALIVAIGSTFYQFYRESKADKRNSKFEMRIEIAELISRLDVLSEEIFSHYDRTNNINLQLSRSIIHKIHLLNVSVSSISKRWPQIFGSEIEQEIKSLRVHLTLRPIRNVNNDQSNIDPAERIKLVTGKLAEIRSKFEGAKFNCYG